MPKVYFAIEEVRGGKVLSEIIYRKDHFLGYRGYILDPNQRLFAQESLEEGLVTMNDIDKIKLRVTDIKESYEGARHALKQKGATHCIYCNRTIDDCLDYDTCEGLNRIKVK